MRRLPLPPRRLGPLPEIPWPETDEILSSWVARSAAMYRTRPEVLLEQVGVIEHSPIILDRQATPADLESLAIAMHSSPQAIRQMSFAGQSHEALEFVAHRSPIWTCHRCATEFACRGLVQVRLRQWFVAVASWCRRCGGPLSRTRAGRTIREILARGDLCERHTFVSERLARAFDHERPVGAVTHAMRALAAPVPRDKKALYVARNRGRLPDWADRTQPLLWQLVGTSQLRGQAYEYRSWRPPANRPYAAWPYVGQIAATTGLIVLIEAGMAMWSILRDLGLVEPDDELVVRNIFVTSG